jgi:hypothetical protein
MEPAVYNSIPSPEPPHTWADLLRLVGEIRRVAYVPSYQMSPDEQMRAIRDAIYGYDHPEAADDA